MCTQKTLVLLVLFRESRNDRGRCVDRAEDHQRWRVPASKTTDHHFHFDPAEKALSKIGIFEHCEPMKFDSEHAIGRLTEPRDLCCGSICIPARWTYHPFCQELVLLSMVKFRLKPQCFEYLRNTKPPGKGCNVKERLENDEADRATSSEAYVTRQKYACQDLAFAPHSTVQTKRWQQNVKIRQPCYVRFTSLISCSTQPVAHSLKRIIR